MRGGALWVSRLERPERGNCGQFCNANAPATGLSLPRGRSPRTVCRNGGAGLARKVTGPLLRGCATRRGPSLTPKVAPRPTALDSPAPVAARQLGADGTGGLFCNSSSFFRRVCSRAQPRGPRRRKLSFVCGRDRRPLRLSGAGNAGWGKHCPTPRLFLARARGSGQALAGCRPWPAVMPFRARLQMSARAPRLSPGLIPMLRTCSRGWRRSPPAPGHR